MIKIIIINFIFLSAIACSKKSNFSDNNKIDSITDSVFQETAKNWGVIAKPLTPKIKSDHLKVLKTSWYEVDTSRTIEMSKIAKLAIHDSAKSNGFEIVGSGGSETSHWTILKKGNKEVFFSIVASPNNDGVKVDIFRNH